MNLDIRPLFGSYTTFTASAKSLGPAVAYEGGELPRPCWYPTTVSTTPSSESKRFWAELHMLHGMR